MPPAITMEAPFSANQTGSSPGWCSGDVILYNRSAYYWSTPQVGDVVMYEIPDVRISGQTAQGQNAIYEVVGRRIDRIVAGPGQQVLWKDRQLWVDGQPSSWLPLNPERLPEQLTFTVAGGSFTVPEGRYLILPSTDPQDLGLIAQPDGGRFAALPTAQRVTLWISPADWQQISVVPASSLVGTVYLRSQPLWRLWRIR